MKVISKEEKELRDEFLKYYAWLLASGMKPLFLADSISEFWINKLKELK